MATEVSDFAEDPAADDALRAAAGDSRAPVVASCVEDAILRAPPRAPGSSGAAGGACGGAGGELAALAERHHRRVVFWVVAPTTPAAPHGRRFVVASRFAAGRAGDAIADIVWRGGDKFGFLADDDTASSSPLPKPPPTTFAGAMSRVRGLAAHAPLPAWTESPSAAEAATAHAAGGRASGGCVVSPAWWWHLAARLPLTAADVERADALRSGCEAAAECSDLAAASAAPRLRAASLGTLRNGGWLDDAVVNGYAALIAARSRRVRRDPVASAPCARVTAVSSHLLAAMESGAASVADGAWARGDDLFASDVLLFPVNKNKDHWILLVAELRHRRVVVYDSLGRDRDGWGCNVAARRVLEWIASEAARRAADAAQWAARADAVAAAAAAATQQQPSPPPQLLPPAPRGVSFRAGTAETMLLPASIGGGDWASSGAASPIAVVAADDAAQQAAGTGECGVFVCMTMRAVAAGIPTAGFLTASAADVENFRRRIALELSPAPPAKHACLFP